MPIPYDPLAAQWAALLAKLRTAIRAECVAHKLSPEEQFETMRYAERLLDDILESVND